MENDHDLLIRIDTKLQSVIDDNKSFKESITGLYIKKSDKEDVDECLKDHELRMRKIERVMYCMFGVVAVIQIIMAIAK